MAMTHRLNLLAMALLGTLWAGLLVIGGAALALDSGRLWPSVFPAGALAGFAAVAAGQYVFLVVVGDRLFPRASRQAVASLEVALGGLFALGALGALGSALLAGASS